jgi:hypothetical protein
MEEERVEGAGRVAALLRQMADGVDARRIPVGRRLVSCGDDLVATVQVPTDADGRALVIGVHFTGGSKPLPVVALEEELAHPGG